MVTFPLVAVPGLAASAGGTSLELLEAGSTGRALAASKLSPTTGASRSGHLGHGGLPWAIDHRGDCGEAANRRHYGVYR